MKCSLAQTIKINCLLNYSWDVSANTWVDRSDGEYTFDGETFHDLPDMSYTRYELRFNRTPVFQIIIITFLGATIV